MKEKTPKKTTTDRDKFPGFMVGRKGQVNFFFFSLIVT